MALINCPECGHLMSDTSKKCPNCGYKKKRSIHLNKKAFLGAFFFILGLACVFFAWNNVFNDFPYYGDGPIVIWDDFMTSNLLFGLICMPLSVIFFVLSGKFFSCLFQKSTLIGNIVSICLIAYYVIMIIISGGFISSTEYEERELASQSVQSSTSNIKEDNDNAYLGTYEYIQPQNQDGIQSLKLVINPDKTARAIINKNGTELIAYGSYFVDNENGFLLSFNDTEEHINGILYIDRLRVYQNFSKYFGIKYGYIKYEKDEGKLYLYEDSSHGHAKDPTKRVELQKIE